MSIIAGRVTFPTAGTATVSIGASAQFVEFMLGSTNAGSEDGIYWSYGIGDLSYQDSFTICGKSGTTPADKTYSSTNRILVAKRKSGGSIVTVLEVQLINITATDIVFNVITANPNLSPIMKVYL